MTAEEVVAGVTVVNSVLLGGVLAISFVKRGISALFAVSRGRIG